MPSTSTVGRTGLFCPNLQHASKTLQAAMQELKVYPEAEMDSTMGMIQRDTNQPPGVQPRLYKGERRTFAEAGQRMQRVSTLEVQHFFQSVQFPDQPCKCDRNMNHDSEKVAYLAVA